MTKQAKLALCRGCRNDDYNGRNSQGIKECFSLEGAKPVRSAFVSTSSVPPWHEPVELTLDCHQRERYVRISKGHPNLAKERRALEVSYEL